VLKVIHLIYRIDLFNPLNDELNLICHLLALFGAHHIFHVSGLRVKLVILVLGRMVIVTDFYSSLEG